MSGIILDINPINWFNYKGRENKIKFSRGTNVLVGTNNAGKTKLHNAFRYILTDSVIIKERLGRGTIYTEKNATDENVLLEVFNNSAYQGMKPDESSEFGVALTFEYYDRRDETTTTYRLLKTIEIRKIDDYKCEFVKETEQVFKIDKHTKSARLVSSDFQSVRNQLLSPLYAKYFLIEGEQMGMMTPLKGDGLKGTINNLTQINSITRVVKSTDSFQKKIKGDISQRENKLKNLEQVEKENIEEKGRIESKIDSTKQELKELLKIKTDVDSKIEDLQVSFNQSKDNRELLNVLQGLMKRQEAAEKNVDDLQRIMIKSYTDSKSFLISRLSDDEAILEELASLDNKLDQFIQKRRIELKDSISKEDQHVLSRLVKTQPHPEILREMINDHIKKCYICKSELNSENIDFIENVLLPHYEMTDESENMDEELLKLDVIKSDIKQISNRSRKYYPKDLTYIKDFNDKIAEAESIKLNTQDEVNKFIDNHGDTKSLSSQIDNTTLFDFTKAIETQSDLKKDIKEIQAEYEELTTKYKNLSEKVKSSVKDPSLIKFHNLREFINELDEVIEEIKEQVYRDFAQSLQLKANDRYKQLMRHNPLVKNNTLIVDVERIEEQFEVSFNFEVNLQDQFGNKLTQEGGASSTLEPLSIVFGLIDCSPSKKKFPFIADAPVSRLTEDTKLSFFQTILNDDVLSQSIIICMDLIDNRTGKLNKLGEDVKEVLKIKNDSNLMIMNPLENNQGVNFTRATL